MQRGVLWVAAAAVLLGIVVRFANLGAPLFWSDEAYTALRVSGHSDAAFRRIFDGRQHSVGDVRAFTTLDPRRGVVDVVRALEKEDPHHAPAFYVLDRLWIGTFGSTPAGFRGLSAALGVLGIALAFALGAVLASRVAGALFAALFALSPLFVLYARQAREYALFMDATLLGTLALTYALRTRRSAAWVAYGITVALGAYVDPIYAFVVLAHGICALLEERRWRALGSWAVAAAAGALAFLPWALNALRERANITGQMDWAQTAYPPLELTLKWIFNVAALGFDAEFRNLALTPFAAAVILLLGAGVFACVRAADARSRRIALLLGATTLGFFIARDVLGDAHYEVVPRYLMPLWIGLLLAAALGCEKLLRARAHVARAIAFAGWCCVLAAGLGSALVRGNSQNWWDDNDQVPFQTIAATIDRASRPLVISESHWLVPLVIARYVRPDGTFLLFTDPVPAVPARRNAFIVTPTAPVLARLTAETRGVDEIDDISPPPATIIAAFHRRLRRDAPATVRGDEPAFVPQNALYRLRPKYTALDDTFSDTATAHGAVLPR